MPTTAYAYILASRRHGTICIGVTTHLAQRMHQHRHRSLDRFTRKCDATRLVWFVQEEDISAAITLEKMIKNRGRQWKLDLMERENPRGDDLAAGWTTTGSGRFAQEGQADRASTPRPRQWAECTMNKQYRRRK